MRVLLDTVAEVKKKVTVSLTSPWGTSNIHETELFTEPTVRMTCKAVTSVVCTERLECDGGAVKHQSSWEELHSVILHCLWLCCSARDAKTLVSPMWCICQWK